MTPRASSKKDFHGATSYQWDEQALFAPRKEHGDLPYRDIYLVHITSALQGFMHKKDLDSITDDGPFYLYGNVKANIVEKPVPRGLKGTAEIRIRVRIDEWQMEFEGESSSTTHWVRGQRVWWRIMSVHEDYHSTHKPIADFYDLTKLLISKASISAAASARIFRDLPVSRQNLFYHLITEFARSKGMAPMQVYHMIIDHKKSLLHHLAGMDLKRTFAYWAVENSEKTKSRHSLSDVEEMLMDDERKSMRKLSQSAESFTINAAWCKFDARSIWSCPVEGCRYHAVRTSSNNREEWLEHEVRGHLVLHMENPGRCFEINAEIGRRSTIYERQDKNFNEAVRHAWGEVFEAREPLEFEEVPKNAYESRLRLSGEHTHQALLYDDQEIPPYQPDRYDSDLRRFHQLQARHQRPSSPPPASPIQWPKSIHPTASEEEDEEPVITLQLNAAEARAALEKDVASTGESGSEVPLRQSRKRKRKASRKSVGGTTRQLLRSPLDSRNFVTLASPSAGNESPASRAAGVRSARAGARTSKSSPTMLAVKSEHSVTTPPPLTRHPPQGSRTPDHRPSQPEVVVVLSAGILKTEG